MRIAVAVDQSGCVAERADRCAGLRVFDIGVEARPVELRRAAPGARNRMRRARFENGVDARKALRGLDRHGRLLELLADCEAAVLHGPSAGLIVALAERGVNPFVTSVRDPEEAARQFAERRLVGDVGNGGEAPFICRAARRSI